jgi:hypothetical protein
LDLPPPSVNWNSERKLLAYLGAKHPKTEGAAGIVRSAYGNSAGSAVQALLIGCSFWAANYGLTSIYPLALMCSGWAVAHYRGRVASRAIVDVH